MEIISNDDARYLAWVAQNTSGFVLNTFEEPGANYVVLHKADCPMISSPKRTNYTASPLIKVCATDPAELFAYARGEGSPDPWPCGLCKPATDSDAERPGAIGPEDVRGFEYWIRGYQNFYEPIVLAHFRDQGFEGSKWSGSIEKADLREAARRLAEGERRCGLGEAERKDCVEFFEKRTRILTDGVLKKRLPDGREVAYSVECKSWGGFCSGQSTLAYFLHSGGWFMLVDRIRGVDISGSVLVIGGRREDNPEHDKFVRDLSEKYGTDVKIDYLQDIFEKPGPQTRHAIQQQLERLRLCVERIEKDLKRW